MTTEHAVLTGPSQTSRTLLRLLAVALALVVIVGAAGFGAIYASNQRLAERLDRAEEGQSTSRTIQRDQAAALRENAVTLSSVRDIALLFAQLTSPDPATRADARRRLGELQQTSLSAPATAAPPGITPRSESPTPSPRTSPTPTAPSTTTTAPPPSTTTTRPALLCRVLPCSRRLP